MASASAASFFLAFRERLHISWRDQPHIVSQAGKLPAPVMRAGTRFQRHYAPRLPAEERQQLGPAVLLANTARPRSPALCA
jgi:hypothetical protein